MSWSRQKILDIYNKHGYVYKKYPSKAKLLQQEFHKFAFLDPMDIEHLLRYMAQNETRTDVTYCINRKRTYNDCKIVNKTDDKLRLEALQNKVDSLKQKYDVLCNNLSDIRNKYEKLIKKYQKDKR